MKRQWDMTDFLYVTDRNVHANMPFGIKNAPVFNVYSDENGGEFLVQKLYVKIVYAIRGGKTSLTIFSEKISKKVGGYRIRHYYSVNSKT